MTANRQVRRGPEGFSQNLGALSPLASPRGGQPRTPFALSPVAWYTVGRRVHDSPCATSRRGDAEDVAPLPQGYPGTITDTIAARQARIPWRVFPLAWGEGWHGTFLLGHPEDPVVREVLPVSALCAIAGLCPSWIGACWPTANT
jgi:hypothetical protein